MDNGFEKHITDILGKIWTETVGFKEKINQIEQKLNNQKNHISDNFLVLKQQLTIVTNELKKVQTQSKIKGQIACNTDKKQEIQSKISKQQQQEVSKGQKTQTPIKVQEKLSNNKKIQEIPTKIDTKQEIQTNVNKNGEIQSGIKMQATPSNINKKQLETQFPVSKGQEPFTPTLKQTKDNNLNKTGKVAGLATAKINSPTPPSPKTQKELPKTTDFIAALDKLRPNVKYRVIRESGPDHAPIFQATITVDGCMYEGRGGSKKLAQASVAGLALGVIEKIPKLKIKTLKVEKPTIEKSGMLLQQLYPKAVFECQNFENGFQISIKIGENIFFGSGPTKKVAKNEAATKAVIKLTSKTTNKLCESSKDSKEQTMADQIGRLIHKKYNSLLAKESGYAKYKVLAGIVMMQNKDLNTCKVIAVTTGSKCVSGEHLSLTGSSLHDMHAEVVARRCLINFFYDQLDLIAKSHKKKSIFTLREDGKGYKLKNEIEFHLYISTAPCGDGRIFSPSDKDLNSTTRGQLRVKTEASEGTCIRRYLQTYDGILGGENLLNLSCSDKICRWNVVGVQGALLSHFIEPIYFKAIILGNLLHKTHLYRALCGRIENEIKNLPLHFHVNKPSMFLLTSKHNRAVGEGPRFSINWCSSNSNFEVVITKTGKPEKGISQICKRELFKRFMKIVVNVPSITEIENKMPASYSEIKAAAYSYKVAKEHLYEAFFRANLGTWVSKPTELDAFEVVE